MVHGCYLIVVIPLLKYLQIDIKKLNSIVIKNRKSYFDKLSFFFNQPEKILFAISRLKC